MSHHLFSNRVLIVKRFFFNFFLVVFISVPLVSLALSDGNLGIGVVYQNNVHPENLVYELKPGDVFEDEAIISNTGTKVAHLKFYAEDKLDVDGKAPRGKFLSQWVSMEKTSFDLPPNTTRIIKFRTTVPLDAEKGLYKGSIFIHEPPAEGDVPVSVSNGSGGSIITLLGRRIGLGMYLTVTSDPHMPPRFKKNISSESDRVQFIIVSMTCITILIAGLLVIQERRKIRSSHK